MASTCNEDYIKNREKKLLDILEKLPDILEKLPDILASIPDEWFENDDLRKIPLTKEVERMERILRRIETDPQTFWEVLK